MSLPSFLWEFGLNFYSQWQPETLLLKPTFGILFALIETEALIGPHLVPLLARVPIKVIDASSVKWKWHLQERANLMSMTFPS